MKISFIFFLLFNSFYLLAQTTDLELNTRPLNNINLNFLGDASLFSLNYERQFVITPKLILSSKLGLGYNEEFQICIWGPCSPPESYITIPHHFTSNFGKGRHFFEFGVGGAVILGKTEHPYLLYPIAGYRFLPLKSDRLNFRVFGHVPFSGLDLNDFMFVPFGVNIGYSFN
jgi:hypothetical protein